MTVTPALAEPQNGYRTDDAYDMVVLQPTTLCNLDCSYCYLPDRLLRREMTPRVAQLVAYDVTEQTYRTGRPVTVLWHGGEPTTLPIDRFEELVAPFDRMRAAGLVRHSIQTNASLITPAWVEFLRRHTMQVSVSLDGPAELNSERVNRAGRPAFEQIMAGTRLLQDGGLDPHVICVVTAQHANRARDIIAFLDQAGFPVVGVNIEENEGVATTREMLDTGTARTAWADILTYYRDTPGAVARFGIREVMLLSRHLHGGAPLRRDPLPTITWDGDIVLLSPELAGVKAPRYGDFVAGNINHETIQSVLGRRHDIPYVAEFERALTACQQECSYWQVCYGGYASNRYAEHGRFDVTETQHCRTTRQAFVQAVLDVSDPAADAGMRRQLLPLVAPGLGNRP